MEGLEISEIKLSQLYSPLRIDAETYQPHYLAIEEKIFKKGYKVLGDISLKIKKGIFDIKSDVYTDQGIAFARISNLKNMRIDTNDIIYIPENENNKNLDTFLEKGDVVLSKTAYPAASIVQLDGCNVSQDTVAIKLKKSENFDGASLVVFLNTRYGLEQMRRWFTGNIQMHLNLTDCKGIFIPCFESKFRNLISRIFWDSLGMLDEAKRRYDLAESLLLSEIGFDGFVPSADNINTKKYSESFLSSGRIDSEYYQPKYEQYEQAVLGCSLGHTLIQDEFVPVKEGANLTKSEYKYIEIGDVNVGDGSCNYTIRPKEELPANAKYLVQKGDLLISKVRPNRGAVTIIPFDESDLIVSGAFTVLRAKPKSVFSNETLKVLLRTTVYKDWLLKFNVGTQYPVIKDEDILNLPIPKISAESQLEISAKIKEAEIMRHKSESLLETAKRAVEIAIEQDEVTAEKYIQDECLRLGVSLDMTKTTEY